ncbi:hypothetical protein LPJ56_006617, partial [Coemansia sp. RSA 2599]
MYAKIQVATLAFAALAAASYHEVAPNYAYVPAAPVDYYQQQPAYYQYSNGGDHYGRATEETNTPV